MIAKNIEKDNLWKTNKIFKDKYISIGWDFSNITDFPRCDYVSADTETKLYYDSKLLTEDDCYHFYKDKGAKWCRTNIEVKAYAFMLSDGDNFALFTNIEDFMLCCATMLVKKVFWYNARFDFAIFDYYLLTHNWKRSDEVIEDFNHKRHKISANTYQSLDGDFGQRYQMRLWVSYRNKSSHIKTHNFKMIDICNIYGGGLKKNLEDWKIKDKDGNDIRKLEMDYVAGTIEEDLQYMINDTKGLHLLAEAIDKAIKEISGFSLFDGDFITAGGLAKKSLLKYTFGCEKYSDNVEMFKYFFPMSLELDADLREHNLYQGGKCFVSPYYVGKIVHNVYKYDVNSMYPAQMNNMKYPIGKGRVVDKIGDRTKYVYMIKLNNIIGTMRENMIPVWYDRLTMEYVDCFFELETKYMWLEEIEILEKYYVLGYNTLEIVEYDAKSCAGIKRYINNYYSIKKNSKGAIRNGAKLFLNSAYGKLAQRVQDKKYYYSLSEDGYVHLVEEDAVPSEKSLMSVLVGSRITALARVSLMDYILKICKDNPKKYFLYCDTDSVHSLCPYEDTDAVKLGMMKCEGVYESAKYLAPKSYLMYNNLEETYEDDESRYEVHCKGVNTKVVENELLKCKTFEEASDNFKSGKTYKCLVSLNCKGGKALIYIDKMILNPKLEKSPIEDDEEID